MLPVRVSSTSPSGRRWDSPTRTRHHDMMQHKVTTLDATELSKTLDTIFLGWKIWAQKIWFTPTQITPTQFPPTWEISYQKINLIWSSIIYDTKWCHGNHMIHKLTQILRQHNIVHFLWKLYHATLLTQRSLPVTLFHHSMDNHLQEASLVEELLRHKKTHPNRYHMYQMTLIQTPKLIRFFFIEIIWFIKVQVF